MKKLCCIYEARDLEGKLIARGFNDEVGPAIGVRSSSVGSYACNEKLAKKKYKITQVDRAMKEIKHGGFQPKTEPKEETFVERYLNLDRDGNTIINSAEYKRHHALIENKGYDVTYRKIKDGRRTFYIVEVV